MELYPLLYPAKLKWPTSCRSQWTSSKGLEACHSEGYNGLECILPARHGSQMGSGPAFESRVIPVTRFFASSFFTPARLWCASLLCHKSKSRGIGVAGEACSTSGTVWPSRKAELLLKIDAMKRGTPVGRWKDMQEESIVLVKFFCLARKRTDRRLFLKSGTCRTLVNSKGCAFWPFIIGTKCCDPRRPSTSYAY